MLTLAHPFRILRETTCEHASLAPQGQGGLGRKTDGNQVYYLTKFWEKSVSRNLDNLKRLFQKLQVRYGADDAMVLQVKQAVESREAIESRHWWWSAPRRERRSGRAAERRFDAVSGG